MSTTCEAKFATLGDIHARGETPHISKFNPWNLFLHSRMINLMLFIPFKLWSTLVEVDLVNFAIFFNPSLAIYFKMLNGIRVLFLKLFCGELFNIRSKGGHLGLI